MANNQEVLFKVRIEGEDKTFNSLEQLQNEVDKLNKDSQIELKLDSGEVVKGVDNVKKSMKGLSSGVKSGGKSFQMFDNILKGSGIFALATIVIDLLKELGILDDIFKALKPALQPLANVIQDVFGELGVILGPLIKQLVNALMPAFKALTPILKVVAPIIESIGVAIETIVDTISGGISFFNELTDKMGVFGKVISGLINPIGAISSALGDVFGESDQSDVAKYNEQMRNLEANIAKAEAEAEKYRGTADRLLSLAENSATAEEDRFKFIERAEKAAQKEAAARVKAAQIRVDAIREEIRLFGESQENVQALAEAERELSTQRSDAAQREEEFARVKIENAQAIAESENLTTQQKEEQIKLSFVGIKQQREQNVEAVKRKLNEIDITEELINQNTSGERQVFFLKELNKVRVETKAQLKLANDELSLAIKQEDSLLKKSRDVSSEIVKQNMLNQSGGEAERLQAEIELSEAAAETATERIAITRSNLQKRKRLIQLAYEDELAAAEGNADLIKAAELRKQTELINLEKETTARLLELVSMRTQQQTELIDRVSKQLQNKNDEFILKLSPDVQVEDEEFQKNINQGIQTLLDRANNAQNEAFQNEGFRSIIDEIFGFTDEGSNEKFAKMAETLGQGVEMAVNFASDIFSIQLQNLDEQLNGLTQRIESRAGRLDELRTSAIEATGEQKDAAIAAFEAERKAVGKLEAEKMKAEKRIADIKRKQAIADKANSLAQIAIQTALGVIGAFAPPEGGPLRGPILAGIIGAIGATQAAIVASQPIPQFKNGGFTPNSGSDSDAVGVVHSNEWVAPASMVRNPKFSKKIGELETARVRGYKTGGFVSDNNTTVNNVENITQQTQQQPRIVVDVQEVIDVSDKINRVKSRASL